MWYRNRRSPQRVALQGVARTFQNIRLFHHMTVIENVLVGMDRHLHLGSVGRGATANAALAGKVPRRGALDFALPLAAVGALTGLGWFTGDGVDDQGAPTVLLAVFVLAALAWMVRIFRNKALSSAGRVVEAVARQEAMELLRFVGLDARAGDLAKNLPYGEQRRLEIARALATRPTLLLLDEPAAGMNPAESVELMHLIRRIRDDGRTVLLIEHHMRVVMGISDHITVLVHGTPIAHGTPEEIRSNPKVIEAYLGTEDAEAHG
ncbi:MAG: ABC transporter ATP-binding protein [Deltaproteobacteria bacterium]|nr:ABC transporter ATP-binding protein [Deltaproteobacteria bacterium]